MLGQSQEEKKSEKETPAANKSIRTVTCQPHSFFAVVSYSPDIKGVLRHVMNRSAKQQ